MVSRFNPPPIEGAWPLKIKSELCPDVVSPAAVAELLRGGASLLTASPRLAAEWKRRLVALAPREVMSTPQVECWKNRLEKLAGDDIPVPLNKLQELQLWERIIRSDIPRNHPAAAGLARHASGAYQLLQEYRMDPDELDGCGEEADALARWIAAMRRELADYGRVLAADLPGLLLVRACDLERRVLLDGFDRFTPMQAAWLEKLRKDGVEIACVDTDARNESVPALTECPDAEAEFRHVARRVAEHLQADPHARIAVVTSRQVSESKLLRRVLDQELLEENPLRSPYQAVNMSGELLADQPMIRQLLHFLQLAGRHGATFSNFSPLLFSSGLKGFAAERQARAALDATLREQNRHFLGFKALLGMQEMQAMPQLASVVASLAEWSTKPRPAGEWVKAVHGMLQASGFLQATVSGRSDDEIRQLNAFRESLASLVAVDVLERRLEWGDFLSLLLSVCQEVAHAKPARYPQICVLPLEQVAGLSFDHVYAVGFDEEALPLPAQPAPLLPFSLQRKYQLPGSSATLAFEESNWLWQQLLRSAPSLQISFARIREERELRATPLLGGIGASVCAAGFEEFERLATEAFDDAPQVPLSSAESVSGGTAIIKNQSACPFRAFASHRLQLSPLGETLPGLDAASKGSLIHHALQYLWEHLQSQQALLALDAASERALIEAATEHAWQQLRLPAADTTRQFERERMAGVLEAWLEEERKRPPFELQQCEKAYRLELPQEGDVRFAVKLKADRIDKDADGHRILIDYKTGGKQSVGKWIGERMAEPQLPFYAVAEALGSGDAVCFARVRSGDMGFEGLAGEDVGIKGVAVYKGNDDRADDWPDLLAEWRLRINALAAEFVSGRCEVSPRDANACDYCGLEAVCRIDEIGIDRDAVDGDEA